jgi:hypothetical protein
MPVSLSLRPDRIPAAAGLLLCLALPAAASGEFPAEPGFEVERPELAATVPPGTTVVVRNPFGDVRARFGGYEGRVEVLATLQQFADEGPRLELAATPEGDELRLVAGVRSAADEAPGGVPQPGQRKRADLVVFVPAGVHLRAETGSGLLQVRGLRGNLQGRTGSGPIEVRTTRGDVDLESDSGQLLVALEPLARSEPQRLASRSGGVWVILVEDGGYALEAETRGPVSTDFSLAIEDRPDGSRHARALLGDGAMAVRVASGGPLRIGRRFSPELARAAGRERGQ